MADTATGLGTGLGTGLDTGLDKGGLDKRTLRNAFGRFATGVTVITTVDRAGVPVGLTANSFSSLSLDPALVLWSIDKGSSCIDAFKEAEGFVIHVLADDQADLSKRFARLATEERVQGLDFKLNKRGIPVLEGSCARFECRTAATHEGGDHLILVGEVEALETSDRDPLLFWGGQYRALAPAG